jgi:hypothetical protein
MAANKGKPSGKFAESKTAPGRKGEVKRSGWPEDAPTQRRGGSSTPGLTRGRNRKAGSPR